MPSRPLPNRAASKSTHGTLVVTVTVVGLVAVIDAMLVNAAPMSAALVHLVMLLATTVASSGEPSWNLMPSRRTMVHVVYAASWVTDLARYGTITSLVLGTVSVS